MSKIGNQPIKIPEKVAVTINNGQIQVNGPLGQLQQRIMAGIQVQQTDHQFRLVEKMM